MACTLAESPCDPLHRKLRQLRCLRCRVDCYRVERTSSRAGVSPAEVQRLSRRTFSTTNSPNTCRGIYFVVHEVVDGKGNRMTKRYLVIATAWWLHAASWFLPAIKGFLGSRLDHGIPGWDVFLAATCAATLRDCERRPMVWYGDLCSRSRNNRFVCARLTVDC